MAVNVQAHVLSVTGATVTCALERRSDEGAWTSIAQTAVTGTDGFMNASFASFTAGTSWSFRVRCQTGSGVGTARGEIGVIAGTIA
jgi:hypothetical protein